MNAEQFWDSYWELQFAMKPDTIRFKKSICEFAEAYADCETAEKKLLRDAINQQLAQLRDWANDAERRCKAETAAKEAETARADNFERKAGVFWKELKAAEERADRAERALQVSHNVLLAEFGRKCSLTDDKCNICREIENVMIQRQNALSPIPSPAKPEKEGKSL